MGVKLFNIVCNICQIMPENEEFIGQLQKNLKYFLAKLRALSPS